jgi:hypothetical protein
VDLQPLIEVTNRPGCFAVLNEQTARRIQLGYMKLYEGKTGVVVETASRNRIPLNVMQHDVKYIFAAIDQDGRLTVSRA